jgi:hypothetical protein
MAGNSSAMRSNAACPAGAPLVAAPLDYSIPNAERRSQTIAWCVLLYFVVPLIRSVVQLYSDLSASGRRTGSLNWVPPIWLDYCHLAVAASTGFVIFCAIRTLAARRAGENLPFIGAVILLTVSTVAAAAEASLGVFYSWFGNDYVLLTFLDGIGAVAVAAVPPVILLIAIRSEKAASF